MTLRLDSERPIARLLIDRPDKRNAITQAMWEALPALVDQAMADDAIRVLVLASATPGMFSAGADIVEFGRGARDPEWLAANQAAIAKAMTTLSRAPKPTLALIDGDCIGGGCGLALACDLRVASARSRFGITPAKLGLVYALHDTKLLVEAVGPSAAKRILYTADLIGADEALRVGLIDGIADSADDWLAAIVAGSGRTQRGAKAIVRRILDGQTHDDAETRAMFADAFKGADFAEGVGAFLDKRKPEFR